MKLKSIRRIATVCAIAVAAVMLCGCEYNWNCCAYYTYKNGTDKDIVVTLYNDNYYMEDMIMVKNPDAEPIYSFSIAPGDEFTRMFVGKKGGLASLKESVAFPFNKVEGVRDFTVSNGELLVVNDAFLSDRSYEIVSDTYDSIHYQCVFDDEFFEVYGMPIVAE